MWLQGRDEPPTDIRTKLKDSPINTPVHMLIGMSILAFLCIFMGVYPKVLYDRLPYPVEFIPFTTTRVFSIMQMFIFTFMGFWLLRRLVAGHPTYTLDTDWPIRMAGRKVMWFCQEPLMAFARFVDRKVMDLVHSVVWVSRNPAAALSIKKEEILHRGRQVLTNPERASHYRQRLSEKREKYPGELPKMSLGASLLLILLFFWLYLILYLLWGS
jgi:multicomponent Na+:H+ antiporter subunit D